MKRNKEIRVKFNPKEYDRLKRNCEELGLSVSAYIRLASLTPVRVVRSD